VREARFFQAREARWGSEPQVQDYGADLLPMEVDVGRDAARLDQRLRNWKRRLKRLMADLTLENAILKEVAIGFNHPKGNTEWE